MSGWADAMERLAEDPDAALEALRQAAPNDPEAALALGVLLLESEADDEAGLYWLTFAAQAGALGARQVLARALLQGRVNGRPQPREAVRVLLAAACDGEEEALVDLVHLAMLLDPALLLDAALGLSEELPTLRRAFARAVRQEAPGWYAVHGEDLLAALGESPGT